MKAKDFRALAREALKGRWWNAVLAGIVAALLGGGIMYSSGSGGSSSGGASTSSSEEVLVNAFINLETNAPGSLDVLISVLNVLVVLIVIWAIVIIVIGGAVSFGNARYNLDLIDGKPVKVKYLVSQLDRIGSGFVMNLLILIYTLLWMLLFIIPGIIAIYSYALTPYILYENPDMRPKEAIRRSKEMMKGRKWRLFCMLFSFFGWRLLSLLTLGIGLLFVRPYMEAAGAAFYRQVQAEIASEEKLLYGEYTVS